MTDNKGFTVIELILAIAIAGIIMGAVGTFLTFNLRSFNATTDVINVQYEGQLVMNQLTDIAKQSQGIEEMVDSSGGTLINYYTASPYRIRFRHTAYDSSLPDDEKVTMYDVIYLDAEDRIDVTVTSSYGESTQTSETYTMAMSIEDFTIQTVDTSTNFQSAKSIQMMISLKDNDAVLDLHSHVKFRNKW